MKRISPATVLIVIVLASLMVVQTAYLSQMDERISVEPDEEPYSGDPWEHIFTVDGQWAIAITPYNGNLYLAERDYVNHTAFIYESTDGKNFTKKYNTQSDQVFVMGVNELNNTLYIGTLWRIGQGTGGLFYVNGASFGQFDTDVWWNSSTSNPAVPLSMHMYKNRFFVGGLSWVAVGESGNKMWVKYEDQNGDWYWTDMSTGRLGTVIEAYSLEEYNGKLYSGTFEPAKVVVYDDPSGMWYNSLTGTVDGPGVGNSGVIELVNYSGKLHGLTWKYGCDWYYDGISWQGGNVSQYGGFGRAIEHNGTLYAGTTPFYEGIKPWTFSNISSYDGTSWTDEWLIDTIVPMYFAKYDGYIYATAGRKVYRMNTNAPTPPITEPPRNLHARLMGPGHVSVNITWDLSLQDKLVVNYTVYHSNTYRKDRQGYEVLAEFPKGTTEFVHAFAGHGDPDNHFYYVQANGTNNSAQSVAQVAKFSRDVSTGPQLISIPLEQQDDSLVAVFATINHDRIWTFDSTPVSGGWTDYVDQKPWWSAGTLNFERGYWVDVTTAGQFTVAGRVPASTVLHLYAGWNLISFPSFENYDVTRVVMETGTTRVEMCDPLNVPYRLMQITGSTMLAAGEGYWIFVPTGANWTVV
jgi:hypothetical protein